MSFKGKKILFVEHGGIYKEFTVKKAKELGLNIFVVTTKTEDVIFKYINKENVIITDTFDSGSLIKSVEDFMTQKGIRFDMVVTFKESSVITTADLAEALGLRNVGSIAARKSSQNKLQMRNALSDDEEILQPNYKEFNIFSENYPDDFKDFNFPCVIKPLFGSSSHGVIKIDNFDEVKEKIELSKKTMVPEDREVFKKFDGTMLMEEYISGDVISIDGLVANKKINILGSVEFEMSDEPYFYQISSFIPSNKDGLIIEKCINDTKKIINSLGFNTCGFHCEWRIKNGDNYFIETSARTVGGGIINGHEKVTGVNLIKELFSALLGEELDFKVENNCTVKHNSIFPDIKRKSKLLEIENLDYIKNNENVWDFMQFSKSGDVLYTSPQTPSQLCYFAVEGKTLEEVNSLTENLSKKIKYKVKEI